MRDVPERLHGYLVLYCEHSRCPARTIEIFCKDHGDEDRIEPRSFRCPVCGSSSVSIHAVRTFDEAVREQDREARQSVNAQMWIRDHPKEPMPLSVLFRQDLPPTPAGWWDKEERGE